MRSTMNHFIRTALLSLLACLPAAAATVSIPAGSTVAEIQSLVNGAATGSTVAFAAGIYDIGSTITIPCNSLVVTGPVGPAPTAKLHWTSTPGTNMIFGVNGCSSTTIENLNFDNAGGIFINAPVSNVSILNNTFTTLPSNLAQYSDPGIYIHGVIPSQLTANVNISGNTFGDSNSCANTIASTSDEGGYCAGILFQTSIQTVNVTNNKFVHLEEGFHVLCYGNTCSGSAAPTWTGFTATGNDFQQIHRIAMEMQLSNASNDVIAYNTIENFYNPSTFTMGISAACCTSATSAPSVHDNVVLANVAPTGSYIAYGIEAWGNGSLYYNNVVQGYWANGIVWGYGAAPWAFNGNTVQGPYFTSEGCVICSEKEQSTSIPTQTGNITGATITPLVSAVPTILPTSGQVATSTVQVTLAEDTGTNTSTWYTIDGSIPVPGQGTAQRYFTPFSVPVGTTVKAVGMWGAGANIVTFPTGYGYVPSAVVSATYTVPPPPTYTYHLSLPYQISVDSKGNLTIITTTQLEAQ